MDYFDLEIFISAIWIKDLYRNMHHLPSYGNQKKKYTDVADFTHKGVGSWSEGCQVIGSGRDFYDFWHNTTNYAQETKQTTWYYTLGNIDTLKTTKQGTIK